MRMTMIAFSFAILAVTSFGRVICSGYSVPVPIDSRIDAEPILDLVVLPWNAAWIGGDTNAIIVISDNSTEVRRVTGVGEFEYALAGVGRHDLTYTTYISGVAQREIYSAIVYAQWKYEVKDGKAIITKTAPITGMVNIPSVLDGYPVVGIASRVFQNCTGMTSVMIPNGVTTIGDSAFAGCSNLMEVVIPGNVLSIGAGAFKDCTGMTGVTILNGVTSIGDSAFAGCSNLMEVVIPGSVLSIGAGAFKDCTGMTGVKILNGVTSVGDSAFAGCSNLTEVVIPGSVWSIGARAFKDCKGLRHVELAKALQPIVDLRGLFEGCPVDIEIFYITPEIRNVSVRQRYPWNEKVDITFEVVGDVTAGIPAWKRPILTLSASNRTDGASYVAAVSAFSGDTGVAAGPHHVVWDLNVQGLAFKSDDVVFTVSYKVPLYCVIDLSGGESTSSYPISYLSEVPSGVWTDEYKTTKLVLRLIEPGSFMMCGLYDVTLTKPFYIGVFEVTQRQYELVTGDTPSVYNNVSYYATRPVELVSYDMIRGSSSGAGWPGSSAVDVGSFMGKLRARTGINGFDLPTEAQWEYACRAGTTTDYNNGEDMTAQDKDVNMNKLGRYYHNGGAGGWENRFCTTANGTAAVGAYLPNAWGLYDMHGNVFEWCLDWYGRLWSGMMDPTGASSGPDRVLRGGCWDCGAYGCTSSARDSSAPSYCGDDYYGFRIVRTLSGIEGARSHETVAKVEQVIEICAEESVPVAIDSRIDPEPVLDSVILPWNVEWAGGDASVTVVIADNGKDVRREIEAGAITYTPSEIGRHELTYTTHIDGVAQDEVSSVVVYAKWKYEVKDSGAIITATTQTTGDVIVPSEIDGHPVTGIAAGVFAGCSNLTGIVIHEGVTHIDNSVFSGCDGLTSVTMPVSLIGRISDLFPDSYANLQAVTLTGTAVEIPVDMFAGCTSLTVVDILGTLTRIRPGTFDGCDALVTIVIPETLKDLGIDSLSSAMQTGMAYDANGFLVYQGWLLDCQNKGAATLTVAEGIIGIGRGALTKMYDLEAVTLPQSLKYIAEGAFREDTYLDNLVIPDGVEIIGERAFEDCSYLQTLTLGKGIKSVGARAFAGCSQLSSAAFTDGLSEIGAEAFSGCWRILSVSLPLSTTHVASTAFSGCTSLTGVTLPSHAGKMSEWFSPVCAQIRDVTVPEGETTVVSNMFAGCSSLRTVQLPDTITNIASRAFYGCSALTELHLPEELLVVGGEAFRGCSNISAMALPENVVTLGACAFQGCSSMATLTLPRGLTELPAYVFADCSSLDSFVVPAAVTNLGAYFCPNRTTAIYFLGNAPACNANAYANTRSDLTSYVILGTKGWDGRPNSRDIPASWNGRNILTWSANQFDVTFDANGGIFFPDETNTYACEETTYMGYSLPPFEPASKGMEFDGYWTESSGGTRVYTSTRVLLTKAHTLYAHWKKTATIKVRFNACGGTVSPAEDDYMAEKPYCELPVPVREHYAFAGWWTDAVGGERVTISTEVPKAAHELFAHWTPNAYTIQFHANNGTDATVDQPFTYGDTVVLRLNTFTLANCEFAGWALEPGGAVVYADGKMLADSSNIQADVLHLYAVWKGDTFAVRFDSHGGEGRMDNQTFTVGVSQPLSRCAYSRTGYAFAGWARSTLAAAIYRDGDTVADLTTSHGASVTLYAVWVVAGGDGDGWTACDVAFDAQGGDVEMDSRTITSGAELETLPTAVKDGSDFVGWFTAKSGGAKISTKTVVTGNAIYYARWTQEVPMDPVPGTITVTAEATAAGRVMRITLHRTGGSDGKIAVKVKTQTSTGICGTDFGYVKEVLVWEDGDASDKVIEVPTYGSGAGKQLRVKLATLTTGTYAGCVTPVLKESKVYAEMTTPKPGTITVTAPNPLSVTAGETLRMTFSRTGGSDGKIAVKAKTQASTALMGTNGSADFDYVKKTLEWGDGDATDRYLDIPTYVQPWEGVRMLRVKLATLATGAYAGNLTPALAESKIYAEIASPVAFGTVSVASEVAEPKAGEPLRLVFRRMGGNDYPIAVKYKVQTSTAVAGTDFEYKKGVVTWGDGESDDKVVEVPTYSSAAGKQLRVKLSTLTQGAYEGCVTPHVKCAKVYVLLHSRAIDVAVHDKVQLWEGGPYWATTNIGADEPWEYGYYFWWGDSIGYKHINDAWVASDSSTSDFSFSESNTPTYKKHIDSLKSEGWITSDGVLAPEHDAAHVHWGGNWRMPTKQELRDLDNNCDWTWAQQNGVSGYIVRGRGDYTSARIFLPCVGYGSGPLLYSAGSRGFYWSSVPDSSDYHAWGLDFLSRDRYTLNYLRYGGQPVRPVQGFTK